jgi:oligoendopeptidase F
MKQSKIKAEEYLKDLESILKLIDKVSNFNYETMDINTLNKIIKNKEKQMENKYKDLDSEK